MVAVSPPLYYGAPTVYCSVLQPPVVIGEGACLLQQSAFYWHSLAYNYSNYYLINIFGRWHHPQVLACRAHIQSWTSGRGY